MNDNDMGQESSKDISLEYRKLSIKNWALLFVICYFLLYCNSGMFFTSFLTEWFYSFIVPPFAAMFSFEGVSRVARTGSGDTQFHYFQVLFMIGFAFIASCVLLLSIRRKSTITRFEKIAYMLVRYFVIYMMLLYGLSKVFYLQFQFPSERSLMLDLGEKSPMGLMWTFMGYSMGYTMFVGWLEFFAGFFILFRRTTILGALMTLGVMLNVFVLNMCYDVPVKLFSFHIVLMSLFLLYPVRRELLRFFFGRDKVSQRVLPFFDYGNYSDLMVWAKVGLLVVSLFFMSKKNYSTFTSIQNINQVSGEYTVSDQEFFKDGVEIQDTAYQHLWESVRHLNRSSMAINYKDGRERWFNSNINAHKKMIVLTLRSDSDLTDTLHYHTLENGDLHLTGYLESDSLSIILDKVEKKFLLRDRGFHWVQEYPYNR